MSAIFCRVYEAQDRFGVSPSTIYRWARAGHISIRKVGGCALLRVSEVSDYIDGLGDQMGDQTNSEAV
ncbi:helix-turn-helix domain-containing protein [Mangrovicoccus sp. HB161399]|uniref:helix-turn-helix domain-containing protein n=1 Tax=Mangrovicoccus sp. HB161399 TaxID=2720392 RepID=UPI001553FD5D|nr:helix-turn-helix domain-containing protein [Mangrovicoccus sp. HB161399]